MSSWIAIGISAIVNIIIAVVYIIRAKDTADSASKGQDEIKATL